MKWNDDDIKYLKNNYSNDNLDLLKSNLNHHSWNAIKGKANSLGLKRNRRNRNGLSINEDFFKIWTPEMAYIFGFWIADGNMAKNRNVISFCSKDFNLLELINFNLKSSYKISDCNNAFQLPICNKTIYNDILKLGGTPRKSLTIQFPDVPDEYLSHFIRGEFDGDGCFYIKKDKHRIHNNKYLDSNFVGNIDFLSVLKDKIKEKIDIDPTNFRIVNKNCNRRIYHLTYFGKKAIVLGNYIYQDSENLRLERKFKIYNKMKKEHLKKLVCL